MSNKENTLLQEIQRIEGCSYMSDLHAAPLKDKTKAYIKAIATNEYSLEEWNEAVEYITKTFKQVNTVEEAKQILTD